MVFRLHFNQPNFVLLTMDDCALLFVWIKTSLTFLLLCADENMLCYGLGPCRSEVGLIYWLAAALLTGRMPDCAFMFACTAMCECWRAWYLLTRNLLSTNSHLLEHENHLRQHLLIYLTSTRLWDIYFAIRSSEVYLDRPTMLWHQHNTNMVNTHCLAVLMIAAVTSTEALEWGVLRRLATTYTLSLG